MSQLTEPVLSLIVQIITKICANHNNIDQEINRILETTNGAKYNLTIHERLTLRYIGEQKITNATIASNIGITRGGISKICGRLIKKELITANRNGAADPRCRGAMPGTYRKLQRGRAGSSGELSQKNRRNHPVIRLKSDPCQLR